jgi:hypothetical protein
MSANKPPPDSLLARAAELRAAGSNWEAVATQLNRSAETVRKWPALHPERWAAATRDAERRLAAEAGSESVLVLRQLLRSKDEKVRRDAAKFLIYFRLELAKLDRKDPSDPTSPPPTSDAARLVAFLEGHTDDELARLAAHMFPAAAPAPLEAPAGGLVGPP